MKIVQLKAENVKRLKVVEITPQGNMVAITGKNGQGKTSVLDAIWWALGGSSNISSVPVRKGAESGSVTLDLGQFVVERTFTTKKKCAECKGSGQSKAQFEADSKLQGSPAFEASAFEACEKCAGSGFVAENGSELTVRAPSPVEGKPGPKYDSPQKMLDALVGSLSFDPLEFSREDQGKQLAILRKLVKLDFDFEKSALDDAKDYKDRAALNRAAKEQRAAAAAIVILEDTPAEQIDEGQLRSELRAAYETNQQVALAIKDREAELKAIDVFEKEIPKMLSKAADLRREAEALEKSAEQAKQRVAEKRDALSALPPLAGTVDVDAIDLRLRKAASVNREVLKRSEKQHFIARAETHEASAKEFTVAMEGREKARQAAVAAAQMPVPGLGFGDGCVTLNGLPFDQASDAERLRTSVAIAMAANPKLRVIRIRDGSLLDEDSMKLIAEMAKAGDFQFWVESVGASSDPMAVVMEDGSVKGHEDGQRKE